LLEARVRVFLPPALLLGAKRHVHLEAEALVGQPLLTGHGGLLPARSERDPTRAQERELRKHRSPRQRACRGYDAADVSIVNCGQHRPSLLRPTVRLMAILLRKQRTASSADELKEHVDDLLQVILAKLTKASREWLRRLAMLRRVA
jgi:hypothetical protein